MRMKRSIAAVLLVLLVVGVAGCSASKSSTTPSTGEPSVNTNHTIVEVDAKKVEELIQTDRDLVIVDVSGKWAEGHIDVSYTHLRAHETRHDLVCRLLL